MKSLIKGILIGSCITGIFAFGYAMADRHEEGTYTIEGMDNIQNYCSVRIGYGSLNSGNRCFRNEVMTGYDGSYLYCADISVTCQR